MDLQTKHVRLQKKLLELMIEVDSICRKNHIIYYLHGGNVLGAVRHHGFIPWDDDIDVIMTPDNWKKFYEAFQNEKRANRALVCRENNPEHPYLFARYVDTTTAYTFRWKAFNTGKEGIGVDFVIFERVSEKVLERQKYKKWMILCGELLGRRGVVNQDGDIRLYKRMKRLETFFGEEKVINFVQKKMKKYGDKRGLLYMQVAPHQNFNWDCSAEYFNEPEEVYVEGHLLYAPTNPKGFVRAVYGDDWMILPEPNQRRVHMGDPRAFCSINVSDYEAEREASEWVSPKKYDDCYVKQKSFLIKRAVYLKKLIPIDAKIRCRAYSLELLYKLNHLDKDLCELLENHNYIEINKIFDEYIRLQLLEYKKIDITTNIQTQEFMKPYVIDVPYEKLIIACMSLALTGKYFVAQKILDLNFGVNGELPSEFEELKSLIDISRDWSVAIYDKSDWDEVNQISNMGLLKYPYHVDFLYGKLSIDLKNTNNVAAIKRIIKQVEEALQIHPDSFELLSVLANAKMKLALFYEAKKLYLYIYERSCNGVLNLEISDALKKLENIKCNVETLKKDDNVDSETRNDKIHKKLLQLLREVDYVCGENNIPYFLEPSLAWEAINKGTFVKNRFSNKIIMRSQDRKRFIESISNNIYKNRLLDCFEINSCYMDFSIRYCDETTIMINYEELGLYKCNNISVEIVFISPLNNNHFFKKISAVLFTAIRNASRPNIFANVGIKNILSGIAGFTVMKVFGKKAVKEKCWCLTYKPNIEASKIRGRVRSYNSKWITLPNLDFNKKEIAYIDNVPFPVPVNYIEYVKAREKYLKFSYYDLNNGTLIGIPEVENNGSLDKVYKKEIKKRQKYDCKCKIINRKMRKFSPYIIRGWEYLQRSFIRIEMKKKYLPQKNMIKKLYEEQNYSNLEYILKEYIDNIKLFSRKKLSLYFDPDIFRIAWDIMARRNDSAIIENVLPEIDRKYISKGEKSNIVLHPVYMQWELELILNVLEKDQGNCLYLYADLLTYGLNESNIKLWCKRHHKEVEIVVMQYHKSFQIWVKGILENADDLVKLIRTQRPNNISAREDIIKILEKELPEYYSEYGVVIRYPEKESKNVEKILSLYGNKIEKATIEDSKEIVDLIFTDIRLSAAYTKESLYEELSERIKTGMGRSFIIRDNDRIVAHVATYAETNLFAVVGGFIVDQQYRDTDYAYYMEMYIEHILKSEGKSHVGMVLDKRLQKAFEKKGCKVIAHYGNLSLKDKN